MSVLDLAIQRAKEVVDHLTQLKSQEAANDTDNAKNGTVGTSPADSLTPPQPDGSPQPNPADQSVPATNPDATAAQDQPASADGSGVQTSGDLTPPVQ